MAPITTDLDKIRLEVGDTDPARQLLTDDELNYFLSEHDTALLAAAAACDSLATRFARDYDVKWQGAGMSARGEYSRSQMAAAFAERAKDLRQRADDQADFDIAPMGVDTFSRRELRGL